MCCTQRKHSPSVDTCQSQPDETRHCLPSEASALLPNTLSKFSMAYSGCIRTKTNEPKFPKSPQSKCTRERPGYPSLGKEQRGQNFHSIFQRQVWEHPQLQHPGVLKGDMPGRRCKQPNNLMFKWLEGRTTANKSKPNIFLSSPCFLPHVTINKQLYGVEIYTPPLENLQKDKAGVSDSLPLFHVQIIKCFCSKLLCKPMLDGVWAN